MSQVLITDSSMEDIADAIRAKLSVATEYKPGQMAAAIASIPTGTTPTGTISITQNGTVDVTNYATANVAVSGGGAEILLNEASYNTSGSWSYSKTVTIPSAGTYFVAGIFFANAPWVKINGTAQSFNISPITYLYYYTQTLTLQADDEVSFFGDGGGKCAAFAQVIKIPS